MVECLERLDNGEESRRKVVSSKLCDDWKTLPVNPAVN